MIKSPDFQSAYVSLAGGTLSSITFAEVQEAIQRTMEQYPVNSIGDIDEREVDQKLRQLPE